MAGRGLHYLLDSTFEGRSLNVNLDPVDAVAALTFVPKNLIPSRTKSSTGEVEAVARPTFN